MAPAKLSKACFCCFFRPRATPPSMSTSAPLPPNDSASFMNELQSALHHRSHETSTGATSPRSVSAHHDLPTAPSRPPPATPPQHERLQNQQPHVVPQTPPHPVPLGDHPVLSNLPTPHRQVPPVPPRGRSPSPTSSTKATPPPIPPRHSSRSPSPAHRPTPSDHAPPPIPHSPRAQALSSSSHPPAHPPPHPPSHAPPQIPPRRSPSPSSQTIPASHPPHPPAHPPPHPPGHPPPVPPRSPSPSSASLSSRPPPPSHPPPPVPHHIPSTHPQPPSPADLPPPVVITPALTPAPLLPPQSVLSEIPSLPTSHLTVPDPNASSNESSSGSFGGIGGFFGSILPTKNESTDSNLPISNPSNFRHVSHIGWDPVNGFDVENIPEDWKQMFKKAKVKKSDMKNPETSKFILETVAQASAAPPPPPPPPSSASHHDPSHVPPAPSSPLPLPVPPPSPSPNPSFLSEINSGVQLKHTTEPEATNTATSSNASFLSEINTGVKLKPVSAGDQLPDLKSMDPNAQNSLENTLAQAMAARRKFMGVEDEPQKEEEASKDDDWV